MTVKTIRPTNMKHIGNVYYPMGIPFHIITL